MHRLSGWWWKALLLPACIGYQVLVHSVLVDDNAGPVRLALALIPLLALGVWIAKRARNKVVWTLLLFAVAATVGAVELQARSGLAAANAITHTSFNLVMLGVFGRTLFGGREPLITGFARRFHGSLPADIEGYTRRVTWLWCVFFAAQLAISALLYLFAPLAAWSFFVNILSLPLVALTFIAEYCYRVVRYRSFRHASLLKGIQLFIDDARRRRGDAVVS